MEISILSGTMMCPPRDDSCVHVAICARASPHDGCPHGFLDAYYRSSAWIG